MFGLILVHLLITKSSLKESANDNDCPGLGLIMYIFTTLEFPTYNFDFHLLTTSVNAKHNYYYLVLLYQSIVTSCS